MKISCHDVRSYGHQDSCRRPSLAPRHRGAVIPRAPAGTRNFHRHPSSKSSALERAASECARVGKSVSMHSNCPAQETISQDQRLSVHNGTLTVPACGHRALRRTDTRLSWMQCSVPGGMAEETAPHGRGHRLQQLHGIAPSQDTSL